jgi:hypothetical protein
MKEKLFNVYKNPQGSITVVKMGWSWPAALLGFIWAFYKKLWVWGIIWLIIAIITLPLTFGAAIILPIIWMGISSNKILERKLISVGYKKVAAQIPANNSELARAKYLTMGEDTNSDKVCPMCAEDVKEAAKVCRYCGHNF